MPTCAGVAVCTSNKYLILSFAHLPIILTLYLMSTLIFIKPMGSMREFVLHKIRI